MTKIQEARLRKMGFFKPKDAERIGISQPTLSRLVKQGEIVRIERGIYVHSKADISPETAGFQIALSKFGMKSAIGGMTALFHYRLIEEVPTQTWVLVPPTIWTKEHGYRLMRTKTDMKIGIETKNGYRIASLERTLIEGLKFSSKIGQSTAIKAVKTAIKNKQTNMTKLRRMASALKLESILARFLEVIEL
jgi:predicted transcriptional regulator of viral defense system